MIRFTIPGNPLSKGMPRAFVLEGHARVFTPTSSRDWMLLVKRIAQDVAEKPLIGPVALWITCWFTMPKDKMRKRIHTPGSWKATKPDLKNLMAGIEDALKGVAWLDDSQVAMAVLRKRICPQDDQVPQTEVVIEELDEEVWAVSESWVP